MPPAVKLTLFGKNADLLPLPVEDAHAHEGTGKKRKSTQQTKGTRASKKKNGATDVLLEPPAPVETSGSSDSEGLFEDLELPSWDMHPPRRMPYRATSASQTCLRDVSWRSGATASCS